MKKIATFFVLLVIVLPTFAQAPQGFSYQAVIRNNANELQINKSIGMRITLLQGSVNGTVVYSETQNVMSNSNGLVTLEIGAGAGFSAINWANGPYFIRTETDPGGGTNYSIKGVVQLLSVPYALYSKTSGSSLPGPKGDTGLQGLQGDKGEIGPAGKSAYQVWLESGNTGTINDFLLAQKGPKGDTGSVEAVFDDTQVLTNKTWTSVKINSALGEKATISSLAPVATSGSYEDLSKKPVIPSQYTDAMADSRVVAGITNKVDKVSGKGLSTNDYTTTEKTKLAAITGNNTGDQDLSGLATTSSLADGLSLKVDKVAGKGLSSNDYTTIEKTKLSGIAAGAEVNVQANWTQATTTADDYIKNKPTIPTQYTDAMADARVVAGITNKVDKVSGKGLSTNDYTTTEKTKLAAITGTNTGDQDLSGFATTSALTTGLALKVDKEAGKGLSSNDYTTTEKTKLAGIAENANNYTHPTGDGNLHVPATSTTNDGKVLTAGPTAGSLSWATPYSGLTNFTESNFTHNSKTGVKLQATNADTNVDFVISPKGTGAILAHQPDGLATGGNKRGAYAVDLQMHRNLATEVANGDYSITIGDQNTASVMYASAIGFKNTASSISTTAIGYVNTAIGQYATAIGYANTAGGDRSFAAGLNNTAQSYGEMVVGTSATIGAGNATYFEPTDRLFVIGNGYLSKSDAVTILKNANTTIGGTLTINGNGAGTSLTLPSGRGISGQVLSTDGSGATTWTTASGGTITSVSGTAPIVSSGGTTPAISISEATTSAAGSMSAIDKTKLDGIAIGAEVNVNADWNATEGDAQILNKPTIDGSETKITAGTNVTVTGEGTTASPYVVNAAQATGTAPGQMQYWNGTAWVTVPAGQAGQILYYINNKPQWGPILGVNDVMNGTTGKVWKDRNLGASQVATSSTDASSYGDIYQGGRAADGHQSRSSGITYTLSSSDTPGHGSFIVNSNYPYDWRSPSNNDLWQGVNGTNNPCPSGYRLPTEAEWEAERTSWSSNNAAGAFASPLRLPIAGGRKLDSGSQYNVGIVGYYWSSTVSSSYFRYLAFYSGDAAMSSGARAVGNSIRCIKN